jgi:hypothetical protein
LLFSTKGCLDESGIMAEYVLGSDDLRS